MKAKKAGLALVVIVMLSNFFIGLSTIPENARASILYVGGTGLNNYTTIQNAIDASHPGDTVFVHNGTYYERVSVYKSIMVQGESREATIIDADGTGDAVNISAKGGSVRGFTITNSGSKWMDYAGVRIYQVSYCLIDNNNISFNNPYGIILHWAHFNTISHNVISDNWHSGIFLADSHFNTIAANIGHKNDIAIHLVDSKANTIEGNNISDNSKYGILLSASDGNSVSNNILANHIQLLYSNGNSVTGNVGLSDTGGIDLLSSKNNTVSGNDMVISLVLSNFNTIADNTVSGSTDGIYLDSSSHNMIVDNTAFSTFRSGIGLISCSDNTIWNNSVLSNPIGIYLDESERNTMRGNSVSHNKHGIYLDSSSSNTVSNNTITLNLKGLHLRRASSNNIVDNSISSNHDGIHLDRSNDNTFAHNRISKNVEGVYSYRDSYANAFVDNEVKSNTDGFYIWQHKDSIIVNNTVTDNDVGILVRSSNNSLVANNYASNNTGNGIFVWNSHRSIIDNNIVSSNDNTGIFVWSSHDTVVAGNIASYNLNGIALSSHNVTVTNNSLLLNDHDGIVISGSSHVTARNNTMVECGVYVFGDLLEYWNTHSIDTSNTVDGRPVRYWKNIDGGMIQPDAAEVIIANCTNLIVEDQNLNSGSVGIELGFSSWNTISYNNAFSNYHAGLFFVHSDNNTAHGNIFTNNGNGIELRYSNNNSIANNTLSSNRGNGLILHFSDDNVIANNTLTHNRYGFFVEYLNNRNTISGNLVLDNWCGLFMWDFNENNTVSENNIYSNSAYAVQIGDWWSVDNRNNRIFHNNFVDNDEIGAGGQAYDVNANNQWDDGYPSGGNYWSDYAGSDTFSGVLQNQPGSDGIGDTPHFFRGDNLDRYPLMSTYGMVPVRPPTLTYAILVGSNFEHVRIDWSLSPDDGMGFKSVVGYQIYKSMNYSSHGYGYEFIDSVPNSMSTYVDLSGGEGDPNDYFYLICAVDQNNRTACAQEQAGKFTRPLREGQNLVSIPLMQTDEDIERVLQTVEWDKAWTYSSSTQKWKWHMKFKPYLGDLESVNLTMGIWINVTEKSNLTVAGLVPSVTTIQLREGWNLVGFPAFDSTYTVGDLEAEAGAQRVEGPDTLNQPYCLRLMSDGDTLQAGFGYWVRAESNTTWTVHNP